MPPLLFAAIFITFHSLGFYQFTDVLMLCIMMLHKTVARLPLVTML